MDIIMACGAAFLTLFVLVGMTTYMVKIISE